MTTIAVDFRFLVYMVAKITIKLHAIMGRIVGVGILLRRPFSHC
jgi:hypothetical protein